MLRATPTGSAKSNHFWYSKSVKGGTEFILVDATTATKKAAFDQEKLAAAISAVSGKQVDGAAAAVCSRNSGAAWRWDRADRYPSQWAGPQTQSLEFVDQESAIRFGFDYYLWKCTLTDYKCTKEGLIPQPRPAAVVVAAAEAGCTRQRTFYRG